MQDTSFVETGALTQLNENNYASQFIMVMVKLRGPEQSPGQVRSIPGTLLLVYEYWHQIGIKLTITPCIISLLIYP